MWLEPTGREMSEQSWKTPHTRCLGVQLVGGRIDVDDYGEPIIGDHVLMLFNADHANTITFQLPALAAGQLWKRVFDTALPSGGTENSEDVKSPTYQLQSCSVAVFCSPFESDEKSASA
jgi:glycogen operon protein